jgi:RHS repeat-associated protein
LRLRAVQGRAKICNGQHRIERTTRQPRICFVSGLSVVHFGGKRVAMRQGSAVTYLHGDHLGSTSVASHGTTGALVSRQTYYPYGAPRTTEAGALPTDYTFTGQKLDASDGLMYYGARYYDAQLGRFIQPDTIVPSALNPQALNRYAYVLNNPLKYTDPTGHAESCGMDGCGGKLPDDTTGEAKFLAIYWEAGRNYENYLRAMYVESNSVLAEAYLGAFEATRGQALHLVPENLITQAQIDEVVTGWILGGMSSVMAFNLPMPKFTTTVGVPIQSTNDVFPQPNTGGPTNISAMYPPNNGAAGKTTQTTLKPGTIVDRKGKGGFYVAPQGTPIEQRSLPYSRRNEPLYTYEVVKPLVVEESKIAKWFGADGGGTQYRFDRPIPDLLHDKFLRKWP